MSDSYNYYESDDDSWCYSIGAASDISEPPLISEDDDFLNPSLSTSSGRSTPLDETEYEMDDIRDDDVIVLSDGDDIIVLSDGDDTVGTVAHSQPPATSNGPMSTLSASRPKTSKCTEEETATCSKRWRSFNRPMSMLSTFPSTTSTCTEDETVTVSSESNGKENFPSSSVKNDLPPCQSPHILCFDDGIEVDQILGAMMHNKQLLFRVRWRNNENSGTDYVVALEMNERFPNLALQYYNEYLKNKNKNTDKANK